MGERYSLWGRSGLPGPLRVTHRRRCVPFLFATGYSVKVRSSISVSFWLRMPGHGGAGSRSRNGMFCVPWAGRNRAVAPCLLCEDLAVILVLGGGCGLALTFARLLLRDFGPLVPRPFYQVCGGGAGPGLPGLARLDIPLFSLGAWSLGLASSSVACIPSPFHGLARCGGLCMSPLFEMFSIVFPGNMGSHFLGISRSVFGNV